MSQRIYNINFHGVGTPPSEIGASERRVWISQSFFAKSLDVLTISRIPVRISFDDGNVSDYEVALPELSARNLNADVFIVADRIGTPNYLSAAQIREMHRLGHRIGNHGMHHESWRGLQDEDLQQKLRVARQTIEDIIGAAVTVAACPFGEYDRRVLRTLRSCGYKTVYTSDGGCAVPDAWLQPRETVWNDTTIDDLKRTLSMHPAGPQNAVRRMKRFVKQWR